MTPRQPKHSSPHVTPDLQPRDAAPATPPAEDQPPTGAEQDVSAPEDATAKADRTETYLKGPTAFTA